MPTILLVIPFGRFMPNMSTSGVAVHIFAPIEIAVISVLNYYIAFYAVVLTGALVRRVRNRRRDETGTS